MSRWWRPTAGVAAAMLLCCTGCVSAWWNAFLDPTQVGNFRENVISEIQETITFEDTPPGIPNAVDPTPDDLVAIVEPYEIGPGDVLQVQLLDFLVAGTESELLLEVDAVGSVDIAQIGAITVEGLTAQEVRGEIARRAQSAGIYGVDSDPTITVNVVNRLHNRYIVSGTAERPGTYTIDRPDLTVREAVMQAGGLGEIVKTIYVIRNRPVEKRLVAQAGVAVPTSPSTAGRRQPVSLNEMPVGSQGGTSGQDSSPAGATSSRPGAQPALPADTSERELIEAVSPSGKMTSSPPSVNGVESRIDNGGAERDTALPPFIFVNDRFVEMPPATQDSQTVQTIPTRPVETEPRRDGEPAGGPVDWEALAEEGQPRILRIPADRLRNGDSSYNVVIRNGDEIRLDPGPVGSYVMGGHVVQPGKYPLNGEALTLTQAIFAARGLDPLAWPTRCEIRRRLDRGREQIIQRDLERIMNAKDPDFYIRPDDTVNVGTHAIAPLLYQIRNAFRFSYGFSFAYDRNFAEYDTLAGDYYRAQAAEAASNINQGGLLGALGL